MMATLTVTTAHTFIILTVSHGLLFRQPRFVRRQRRRRICSSCVVTKRHANTVSLCPTAAHGLEKHFPSHVIERHAPSQTALVRGTIRSVTKLCHARVLSASMRAEPVMTFRLNFHGLNIRALNLAILYADQSGVRYPVIACQLSLVCVACIADLLEPTLFSEALRRSGQRGTLISRPIPWAAS